MGQVLVGQQGRSSGWAITPSGTLWSVMLTRPRTINYPSGPPDVVAPWKAALASDGSTALIDIYAQPWVLYTVQGSEALSVTDETTLAGLGSVYAEIDWLVNGRIEDRQQA